MYARAGRASRSLSESLKFSENLLLETGVKEICILNGEKFGNIVARGNVENRKHI